MAGSHPLWTGFSLVGQAQSRWIEDGLISIAYFLGKIDPSRF